MTQGEERLTQTATLTATLTLLFHELQLVVEGEGGLSVIVKEA